MSDYQFRSIMAVLSLIASNDARTAEIGIITTTAFLCFAIGAIWAPGKNHGGGKSGG